MLSDRQRDVIKATVPLLETGGEALTSHFYKLLLTEHSEVRPLFSEAHQASGRQSQALARAVLKYAQHIDRLEELGPLVGQIVSKHVSLQVLPEHYPLVGQYLLRSIREVLGAETATDEVLEAWGVAYGQLADILIGAEEGVYAKSAKAPGGWRGTRGFLIQKKVVESEFITSFHLVPEDGKELIEYAPGQFIGLQVEVDGKEQRRNYSLSGSSNGREYRISVKREEGGKVSNHLHSLQEGARLELRPPAGDVHASDIAKPLALISAGVGITPTISMLEKALANGRTVHFIHCARNSRAHAFREWIHRKSEAHSELHVHFCYSQPLEGDEADGKGHLSKKHLSEWLPENRDLEVYFLGPTPFMAQVRRDLGELGVPPSQTHYHFFGPASDLDNQ
mmetsp:Transcript_17252/g.37782  ORF Transcript_17252/g.37782 Transcript_17252/m.37782 type:complete len:394 (+) Transcript_17252:88-1269(+)